MYCSIETDCNNYSVFMSPLHVMCVVYLYHMSTHNMHLTNQYIVVIPMSLYAVVLIHLTAQHSAVMAADRPP